MYVAIDKFTKWPEVQPVRKVTAQSAVKFFRSIVCHFEIPNRIITDNGTQFTSRTFMQYSGGCGPRQIAPPDTHHFLWCMAQRQYYPAISFMTHLECACTKREKPSWIGKIV